MEKLTIPSGWNEVSVGMFQELSNLDKSEAGLTKIIDLVSILTDTDPEEIKKLNASVLEPIINAIQWTAESPKDEFKECLEIDGKQYWLIKLSSASVADNANLEAYKADITKLHKFFAVLYREDPNKETTVEEIEARGELFKDKVMISDVFGTILFFLGIALTYDEIITHSSKNQ